MLIDLSSRLAARDAKRSENLDRPEKAMEIIPILVEAIQRMQDLGASNGQLINLLQHAANELRAEASTDSLIK
jgi:hypothetical protein